MHRFVAGTCQMTLRIIPQGPWMVRGETRKEGNDVLYPLLDAHGLPVLPASSLKGVLRSTAERILRSMQPDRSLDVPPLADDPFVHDALPELQRGQIADSELREWHTQCREAHERGRLAASVLPGWQAWSEQYASRLDMPDCVYPLLSPASQLFGCTLHAGLVTLNDASTSSKNMSPRTHVAIDRFTGGVGEGPFNEKLVADRTPLTTELTITNFALWQIGLLALVFQEINRGYVGLGGGTRKGQGQVKIAVDSMVFRYAALAYTVKAGIISAQACLAEKPWNCSDIPTSVRAVEGLSPDRCDQYLCLLPDLIPSSNADWHQAGTISVVLPQEHGHDNDAIKPKNFFKTAVQEAWKPWVEWVQKEIAI